MTRNGYSISSPRNARQAKDKNCQAHERVKIVINLDHLENDLSAN